MGELQPWRYFSGRIMAFSHGVVSLLKIRYKGGGVEDT